MNIGAGKDVGRFIVDIDGVLRSTNARRINPQGLIALHGGLAADATIVWEVNGESVPLSRFDCVDLSEDSVAFFSVCVGSRFFWTAVRDAHSGGQQTSPARLPVAMAA